MAPIRTGAWLASLCAVAVFAGCSPKPKDEPVPEAPAAIPALTLPAAPLIVERAQLLTVVGQSASAFATGLPAPPAAARLAGQRFSIRMPFGCLGPDEAGAATYAYDADKGSLKLTARPEVWTDNAAIRDLVATPGTETIEGFWIPRPWITTDACPALRPQPIVEGDGKPAPAPAPAAPTVGLVATFEAGDSRLLQRGDRPYEVVRKAVAPPTEAMRLVLEGRIGDGPGGPVVCRSDNPDRPPICLVRVELDRVAIEGASGELFGEWR